MSSVNNNNHSNGPSNANGRPDINSSGAHQAQNGISPLLKIGSYLTRAKGNIGPGPSQTTANGSSQDSNRPTTASYTGLLSQNGNFGDQFWPVNGGSRNGNSTAGSVA